MRGFFSDRVVPEPSNLHSKEADRRTELAQDLFAGRCHAFLAKQWREPGGVSPGAAWCDRSSLHRRLPPAHLLRPGNLVTRNLPTPSLTSSRCLTASAELSQQLSLPKNCCRYLWPESPRKPHRIARPIHVARRDIARIVPLEVAKASPRGKVTAETTKPA